MHSKNIIHQDVKPDNILIFEDNGSIIAKLCDFGMSEFFSLQGNTHDVYTHWYRAPEITTFESHSYNADIWAVFLIIYEIIFKTPILYKCVNNNHTILSTIINKIPSIDRDLYLKKIDKSKLKIDNSVFTECDNPKERYYKMWNLPDKLIDKFNSTPGTYNQLIDLTSNMSVYNYTKRYNATDCLNHPFFDSKKEYIQSIRNTYKYTLNCNNINLRNYNITIKNDSNRKSITYIIFNIFNNRDTINWYSHKILFHSLSLWDLYYNCKNQIPDYETTDLNNCTRVFYSILYLCIKYFSIFPIQTDFNKLTANMYINLHNNNLDFERRFIRDILQCRIYRNTIYECTPEMLNEYMICNLLKIYGELPDCTDVDVIQLSHSLYTQIK